MRVARDLEMIAWATELQQDAARKAGAILRDREMAHGGRPIEHVEETGNMELPVIQTLADLGVTKMQSSRWQKLAALDDETFEARKAAASRAVAMQFLADAKLADEVEAAEDRGEIGKHGGDHTSKIPAGNLALPTRKQAGLPPNKNMMDARKIRDAIKENPEVVNEVVAERNTAEGFRRAVAAPAAFVLPARAKATTAPRRPSAARWRPILRGGLRFPLRCGSCAPLRALWGAGTRFRASGTVGRLRGPLVADRRGGASPGRTGRNLPPPC